MRQSITRLYSIIGLPAPAFFWVENPVQLIMAPFLLQALASVPHGSQRRALRRSRVHLPPPDLGWQLGNRLQGQWLDSYVMLCKQLTPLILERISQHAHYESTLVSYYDQPDVLHTCSSRMGFSAAKALKALLNQSVLEAHARIATAHSVATCMDLLHIYKEDTQRRAWNHRHVLGFGMANQQTLMPQEQVRFHDLDSTTFAGSMPSQFIFQLMHQAQELTEEVAALQDTDCRHPRIDGTSALQTALSQVEEYKDHFSELVGAGRKSIYCPIWGLWAQDQLPMLESVRTLFGVSIFGERIGSILNDFLTMRRGAFAYVFNSRCVFACVLPEEVHFDRTFHLHNFDGPAIKFNDGYNLHLWRGILIGDEARQFHSILDASNIEKEVNVELRRVLIERFGTAQFLEETGASVVHEDEYGTLLHKTLTGDEAIVMVRVTNKTPEPDGSYKQYYLRVPPRITTAHEAVAWSFNMNSGEYSPGRET